MVLWVDKYRPVALDKMEVHPVLNEQLKSISSGENAYDFPHVLLYGPSGAGKKTRVLAILRQLFGTKAEKLKLENREMKVGASGSKVITVTTLSSPFHIEFNPADAGFSDRYVITNMFKEVAQTASLEQTDKNFKVVIINEVDNLTKEAQQALRRIMEKYMRTCRIILVAQSLSRVSNPVKSRCVCIRVPAPTEEEIINAMEKVAKQEAFQLPKDTAKEIASSCDRNLRRAILMLEAAKVQQYPFKPDQITLPEWEVFIHDIGKDIMEQQTPKRVAEVRDKFYTLLTNCIPPTTIIRKLTDYLISKVDVQLHPSIIHFAAEYEHRMKCGSRAIFHIEAFVVKVMSIYREYLQSMML